MNISEKSEVQTNEIAVVLGLTTRRIQQLTREGVLKKARSRYNLVDSVQRYMDYRSKKNDEDLDATEVEKQEAEVSIKKARAIITVLEAKELQGKMHRSEDVAAMTEDLVYTIRGMLLALPGRLAVDTAAASSPPEAAEIIRQEVYKLMMELSHYQYDPQKYEERVRERKKWDPLVSENHDEEY